MKPSRAPPGLSGPVPQLLVASSGTVRGAAVAVEFTSPTGSGCVTAVGALESTSA
jgi:hypothetical protein